MSDLNNQEREQMIYFCSSLLLFGGFCFSYLQANTLQGNILFLASSLVYTFAVYAIFAKKFAHQPDEIVKKVCTPTIIIEQPKVVDIPMQTGDEVLAEQQIQPTITQEVIAESNKDEKTQ